MLLSLNNQLFQDIVFSIQTIDSYFEFGDHFRVS